MKTGLVAVLVGVLVGYLAAETLSIGWGGLDAGRQVYGPDFLCVHDCSPWPVFWRWAGGAAALVLAVGGATTTVRRRLRAK